MKIKPLLVLMMVSVAACAAPSDDDPEATEPTGESDDALTSGQASAVIAKAKAEIGVPYSWGGGGPNGPTLGTVQGAHTRGFDCSSLMQFAFYQGAGKKLPRVTYDQWNAGTRLAFAHRSPGDLIFYHNKDHVALYVGRDKPGGTEYVVEAPHTGAKVRMVTITSPGTPMTTVVRIN
jgi:cell wall-associated NlpC family hydrolase